MISGQRGICNVFFGHCNLQCRFCQNYEISDNRLPLDQFESSLSAIIAKIGEILDGGARGVGFVSPSHCVPQMLAIIRELEAAGRRPVYVYNSNGFDRVDLLRKMHGIIAVYLPDLKYMDGRLAFELSDCRDYVQHATVALLEMYRQTGNEIELDDEGMIQRGLIIRHLVLPGEVANSKAVLRFIAERLSPDVHISLMSQYHPNCRVQDHPKLRRTLRPEEYEEVLDEFDRLGFHRGWVQELSSHDHYRPDFGREDPFNNP